MKTILNKIATSKIPGVLAGLMVIGGSIYYFNNMKTDSHDFFSGFVVIFLIIFSLFPAFLGALASFRHNKPGKVSYIYFGISQILLGLLLGVLNFIALILFSGYPRYTPYWVYANLVIGGSIIFFISGVYLVAFNSKLREKKQEPLNNTLESNGSVIKTNAANKPVPSKAPSELVGLLVIIVDIMLIYSFNPVYNGFTRYLTFFIIITFSIIPAIIGQLLSLDNKPIKNSYLWNEVVQTILGGLCAGVAIFLVVVSVWGPTHYGSLLWDAKLAIVGNLLYAMIRITQLANYSELKPNNEADQL